MIPRFRFCNGCLVEGREERIGTSDAPLVSITVGLLQDGLAYDARLPRFAWALWTRYRPESNELEPVPLRHEFCAACLAGMLAQSGALDVLTQAEYVAEVRQRAG